MCLVVFEAGSAESWGAETPSYLSSGTKSRVVPESCEPFARLPDNFAQAGPSTSQGVAGQPLQGFCQ